MPILVSEKGGGEMSRGFSLVEVLVGSAIMGIVLGGALSAYVSTRRYEMVDRAKANAWAILISEVESIRQMKYNDLLDLAGKSTKGYWYVFKSKDDDGNPLYGEDAIIEVSDNPELKFWNRDKFKKDHFDPMGIERGSVRVYIDKVEKEGGNKVNDALNIKVVVSWAYGGQVYGGDRNLNGREDAGDVLDGEGRLVSDVSIETATCKVMH